MHPEVTGKMPGIERTCAEHGVRALWLFGSAATPGSQFDEQRSDFDFIVEFVDPDAGPWGRCVFALQRALKAVLGRCVDLFTRGAMAMSANLGTATETIEQVFEAVEARSN